MDVDGCKPEETSAIIKGRRRKARTMFLSDDYFDALEEREASDERDFGDWDDARDIARGK